MLCNYEAQPTGSGTNFDYHDDECRRRQDFRPRQIIVYLLFTTIWTSNKTILSGRDTMRDTLTRAAAASSVLLSTADNWPIKLQQYCQRSRNTKMYTQYFHVSKWRLIRIGSLGPVIRVGSTRIDSDRVRFNSDRLGSTRINFDGPKCRYE